LGRDCASSLYREGLAVTGSGLRDA